MRRGTSTRPSPAAEDTHAPKLLVAALAETLTRQRSKLGELAREHLTERLDRLRCMTMRAAEWLGHDLVDHAEREQILGGQPQRLGCPGDRVRGLLPVENRRTALGRDHRVA